MKVHGDRVSPWQNEEEQDCESFLAQPPPRKAIPDRLLKAGRHRKGDMIAVSIMFPLAVGGMGFMPLLFLKVSLELTLVLCLSVSAATLFGFIILLKRSTARRRYVLENGGLVPAVVIERGPITSVSQGTVENSTVRFAFEMNGLKHQVSQRFANIDPERTARYLSGEDPVRLLVDPLDVTNILWVEGTLMAAPLPSGSPD
jgi:hypothetical protein